MKKIIKLIYFILFKISIKINPLIIKDISFFNWRKIEQENSQNLKKIFSAARMIFLDHIFLSTLDKPRLIRDQNS